MEGPITYQLVESVVTSLAIAGAVWVYINRQLSNLNKDLQEFKLEVAKEYVSTAHLNEVEKRLLDSFTEVNEAIKDLRKEVLALSRKE